MGGILKKKLDVAVKEKQSMNFIPLNVSLDEACMSDFARRYHFEEKDNNEIDKLYRKVAPRIHAQFHYVLLDDRGSALGKDISFDRKNVSKALVVVTLGQAFDEFQDSFLVNPSSRSDIHKAYILDCLGLEYLWAAYDEIDKKIYEFTGLFAGDYTYVGDEKLPLSELPRLMGLLGQKVVTYNGAFALIPKKSVVFEIHLLDKKVKKHGRCSACQARDCSLRRE